MSETEVVEPLGPQEVNCRHCGQPNEVDVEMNPDWLCSACGRYQDATTCPVCGGLARISLLPPEHVPAVHEPTKRRKAKE